MTVLCLAYLYLGVDHVDDLLLGAVLGVAIPVTAFRFFTPNEVFPVTYRRGNTAHVDVTGRRGEAIRHGVRDQLGFTVTDITPVGLESSAGSTPLRLRVEGSPDEYLFGKLYTKGQVRGPGMEADMKRNRPADATSRGNQLTAPDDPRIGAAAPGTKDVRRLLPSSRYRHPGDVIRLIISGLVLTGTLAAVAVTPGRLVRPGAPAVTWPGADPAGHLLSAVLQVAFVVAAAGVVAAVLRRRRFRLLGGLIAGAAAAGGALAGILYLAGDQHPHAVTAAAGHSSLLASAAFPGPALIAAAAAVTVAAAPWLSRPWRRAAWTTLGAAAAARLVTGTVLPAELILALAVGVTVGAGVLVAFGVPDRRMGPGGMAAALRSAGLPVTCVQPAQVETKGSRPFVAVTSDGRRLFIKALGSDQRDADLLYRGYRYARLRNVGDTWPAASVIRRSSTRPSSA